MQALDTSTTNQGQMLAGLKQHAGAFSKLLGAVAQMQEIDEEPTWMAVVNTRLAEMKALALKATVDLIAGRLKEIDGLDQSGVRWHESLGDKEKPSWAQVVAASRPLVDVSFAKKLDSTFKNGVSDLHGPHPPPFFQ